MKYQVMYHDDRWQPITPIPSGGAWQAVTQELEPGRRLLVALQRTVGGAISVADARVEDVTLDADGRECLHTVARLQPGDLELIAVD